MLPPAAPPPCCVCCASCFLVLLRCGGLLSGVLRWRVAVLCAAYRAVVSHLVLFWAAARCAVLFGAVFCVLCCSVPCCCLLLCFVARLWLCCPAAFFALWLAVSSWSALPCAVSLVDVLRCIASFRSARRCAIVRWAVLPCSAWCRCLLCRAPGHCLLPWGVVPSGAAFCRDSLRCVLCALCFLPWCVGACCCLPLFFPLFVSWGALLCVPCLLPSVQCCAVLCWCACVVLFVWYAMFLVPRASGVLLCVVLFPLVLCAAALCCAVRCVLCCAAAHCAVLSWVLSCCAAAFGVDVPLWCLAGYPIVWWGSLCGPAIPWCPAPPCCAPWCCASASWCAVLLCCLLSFVACVCLLYSPLKTTAKWVKIYFGFGK